MYSVNLSPRIMDMCMGGITILFLLGAKGNYFLSIIIVIMAHDN